MSSEHNSEKSLSEHRDAMRGSYALQIVRPEVHFAIDAVSSAVRELGPSESERADRKIERALDRDEIIEDELSNRAEKYGAERSGETSRQKFRGALNTIEDGACGDESRRNYARQVETHVSEGHYSAAKDYVTSIEAARKLQGDEKRSREQDTGFISGILG